MVVGIIQTNIKESGAAGGAEYAVEVLLHRYWREEGGWQEDAGLKYFFVGAGCASGGVGRGCADESKKYRQAASDNLRPVHNAEGFEKSAKGRVSEL